LKYLIIGGVAGGASTAARLRRLDEHAKILLVEKGPHISFANCGLPYYIGGVIEDRSKLFVQTPLTFQQRFHIEVRTMSEVVAIQPEAKTVSILDLTTKKTYTEVYDKLVLSPGAFPILPAFDGINQKGIFTLRNIKDTDAIKSYAQKCPAGKAVLIGAGFIGLEMAENLHRLGMKITIVEMGDQILAPADFPIAAMAQQELRKKGIELRLQTAVTGFGKDAAGLKVLLKNQEPIDADLVILSIGVKPDTKLAAEAGLKLGPFKGILVNEYLQTSEPDIYAVGDAIEFANPISGISMPTFLAGPANKQGRICASNLALGNHQKYLGSINTAIVQIFDLTVGVTGMAAKHLQSAKIDHLVSTTHSGSHAAYYPEADPLTIQIAFAPKDGRLLGAQVIGHQGVDKRIDVLSSLIQQGATIEDLASFEHAYAPPFSSAKDPINMAGFVAENILLKRLFVVPWSKATQLADTDILLDVRDVHEFKEGNIPGAINIPVDTLRHKLLELDPSKTFFVYCQIGLRGYLAQRILLQNGFKKVFNISGGYKLWTVCHQESRLLQKAEMALS